MYTREVDKQNSLPIILLKQIKIEVKGIDAAIVPRTRKLAAGRDVTLHDRGRHAGHLHLNVPDEGEARRKRRDHAGGAGKVRPQQAKLTGEWRHTRRA